MLILKGFIVLGEQKRHMKSGFGMKEELKNCTTECDNDLGCTKITSHKIRIYQNLQFRGRMALR